MVSVTATATEKESGNQIERTGEYEFGESLKEATKIFGEEVVFSHFRQSATISLQSIMRTSALKGDTEEQTAEKIAKWKPSVAAPRKSKVERSVELVAGMSADDREEFMRQLQEAEEADEGAEAA